MRLTILISCSMATHDEPLAALRTAARAMDIVHCIATHVAAHLMSDIVMRMFVCIAFCARVASTCSARRWNLLPELYWYNNVREPLLCLHACYITSLWICTLWGPAREVSNNSYMFAHGVADVSSLVEDYGRVVCTLTMLLFCVLS